MKTIFLLYLLPLVLLTSCSKEWLDKKPDDKLALPSTTGDLWAILDNNSKLNNNTASLQQFAEIGTDNFFLFDATWSSLGGPLVFQQNAYVFASKVFEGERRNWCWNLSYERIYYANVVLDEVENVTGAEGEKKIIKGTALFHRAFNLFWIAQIFAPTYEKLKAEQLLGIPLRLTANLNVPSQRANLKETYEQIINDLQQAADLLPETTAFTTRPSKAAALAMLARIYLIMQEYPLCIERATASLAIHDELIDFNSLNTSIVFPFPLYNLEVIFHDQGPTSIFATSRARVDTLLYASYSSTDLRKELFFEPQGNYHSFNGSYTGSVLLFGGISTAEMVLTLAEAYARQNQTDMALENLNYLLANRISSESFMPLAGLSNQQALTTILEERRKELCFRGIRWFDLRRLNLDPTTQTIVKRKIAGVEYTLLPNDVKYIYDIPDDIIAITGMPQNNR